MKEMKKGIRAQLRTEDWVIVLAGAALLLLTALLPAYMPSLPKQPELSAWPRYAYMFAFLLAVTYATAGILKRPLKGIFPSFLFIFLLAAAAQLVAEIPAVKQTGLESVFFSVAFGLLVSNLLKVPVWMKAAVQSEFYIKIGLVVLGSTLLFGEVLRAGLLGLAQAVVVVIAVWYFAFWVARRVFRVDDEMSTLLASAVSICGVSAAIATCGAIRGDGKKLSYVISLVLVVAIPMMYLMPWLARLMGLSQEVAGAWLGGTIDTTGAVVASGKFLGDTAEAYSVIIKSSQNVLLGLAAFAISVYWSWRGQRREEKPTLGLIWERFPKFVIGFLLASLVFSLCFSLPEAKTLGKISKGFSNALFAVAFVCIGLETRFRDLFTRENRRPLKAFLTAQAFNIVVTLVVAWLLFGLIAG